MIEEILDSVSYCRSKVASGHRHQPTCVFMAKDERRRCCVAADRGQNPVMVREGPEQKGNTFICRITAAMSYIMHQFVFHVLASLINESSTTAVNAVVHLCGMLYSRKQRELQICFQVVNIMEIFSCLGGLNPLSNCCATVVCLFLIVIIFYHSSR